MKVIATVRLETEQVVTLHIDADEPDDIGYREVEDAVYSSGEFLSAINIEVRDYEVED